MATPELVIRPRRGWQAILYLGGGGPREPPSYSKTRNDAASIQPLDTRPMSTRREGHCDCCG
jgi:hypothetical protein